MATTAIVNRADKQKGQFGGSPRANGRYLTAEVKALDEDEEWFRIRLRVFPEPGANPITGEVTFYLHQSFDREERTVRAANGEAKLTVYAYGAFTVGAVLDAGTTRLELDLAELSSAPKKFRSR